MSTMKNHDDIDELLVKALQAEPKAHLPFGFASMVTRKAFASKRPLFRHSLQAILLGLTISLLACFGLLLLKPDVGLLIFNMLDAGKFIIATGIAAFLMVQY